MSKKIIKKLKEEESLHTLQNEIEENQKGITKEKKIKLI